MRVVAGCVDGGNEVLDADLGRAIDRCLLRCEVHRRLYAVEPVQLLLDPRRAGRAVHALELEPDLHGTSVPPGGIRSRTLPARGAHDRGCAALALGRDAR